MNGHYPHQPAITELQGRITKAEATLRDKEEENVMLRQQLEQYERKWSEYEAKMKSMEEAWKRQLSSLQVIVYVDFFFFDCMFKEWINMYWQHGFVCLRMADCNIISSWKFSNCS